MPSATLAPSTHTQPSRKGKRAWRKNVDLTALEAGLESARDEAILTGGKPLSALDASSLFQTDTTGSTAIRTTVHKLHKPLRADEILAQRSAVQAVDTRKRPGDRTTDGVLNTEENSSRTKRRKVSRAELERLKQLAYSSTLVHTDSLQVPESATHDPWDTSNAIATPVPASSSPSYLPKPAAIRAPRTLTRPPISLAASGAPVPSVPKPNAGRSYNPSFAAWSTLLQREGAKEVALEQRRQAAAAAERERELAAAASGAEAELQEQQQEQHDVDDDSEEQGEESEWEGIASESESRHHYQLQKRPERKTPTERNKAARRKAAAALARHEANMAAGRKDAQARALAELHKQKSTSAVVVAPHTDPSSLLDADSDDSETPRLRRRAPRAIRAPLLASSAMSSTHQTRAALPPAPLELTLPSELRASLRQLRPEGNALSERFRRVVLQGKVEGRLRPAGERRKARGRVVEKWAYKDWTLPAGKVGV